MTSKFFGGNERWGLTVIIFPNGVVVFDNLSLEILFWFAILLKIFFGIEGGGGGGRTVSAYVAFYK